MRILSERVSAGYICYDIQLMSVKSCLNELLDLCSEVMKRGSLNAVLRPKVITCVMEAVNNAFSHAGLQGKGQYVLVQLYYEGTELSVTVTDKGKGFNWSRIYDPTSDRNIHKQHGRGIHIMRALADELLYNEQGNQIKLLFKNK